MTAQPHDQAPHEVAPHGPLDAELSFTVQVKLNGIIGPLEIKAQRVSTIQRTLRLLQQNGLLAEQSQPASTDEAPICSIHQKPMKKGQYGWYCPRKASNDEYCKQRVKA
jgi:hypothetical protein